jgi:putative drug exporter of the RND superfamily
MRDTLSPALPDVRAPLPDVRRGVAQDPGGSPAPRPRGPRAPMVERIACWSARHRIAVIVGWLVLAGAALLAGQLLGTQSQQQYDPGQAGRAEQMLHQLNVVSPPQETVLIQARDSSPGDSYTHSPQMRRAVADVVRALQGLPPAARDIRSPLSPGGQSLVSADGRTALVTFDVGGPHASADATVSRDLAAVARVRAAHPGLIVSEAGDASTDQAANTMMGKDFHKAEFTSVPITLILLLAVFGALIAAGIPVLLAGSAVMVAVSLLAVPSRWLPIGSSTSEVVLIIGMAVGVDYSLFYLRREREERSAGASFPDALATAAHTSGRAILVSGLTVMVSLAGLLLTGIDLFTGIAVGTIMVVGVAVVGSLTFLPALLSLLGPWADRGRIPFLGRHRTQARPSRLWAALVRRVVRRPLLWGGTAALALLALAAPALGMRTGTPAIDLPAKLPVVQTLDQIQRAFPGRPAPAQVVVMGDVSGPRMRAAVTALQARASARGVIHRPVTAEVVGQGRGLVISVPLAGDGTDSVSRHALLDLRDQVLPATVGTVPGASYAVTGNTASGYDFDAALRSRTPIVFAVVAGLALLLLMVAFRSLAIPLISIGLNLLSVGAAYGLITLIFQDGHLQGPLGFTSFGGIIPWVPLFMFVFLFGLSMDYHVFILSRIRELRAGGRTHEEAVVGGVAACSGVVTSAAVIMVAVFSIFATLSLIELKMIGVGLASAVLIDATIVRGILVPAALALLGERSWYFPRWLEWLPGWRLEASGAPVVPLPASAPVAQVAASAPAAPLRGRAPAVSVQAGAPAVPAAPLVAAPARREPEVVLAGERTGSREGAA